METDCSLKLTLAARKCVRPLLLVNIVHYNHNQFILQLKYKKPATLQFIIRSHAAKQFYIKQIDTVKRLP